MAVVVERLSVRPRYADFHAKSLRGCRPWSIAGEPYDPVARRRARPRAGARRSPATSRPGSPATGTSAGAAACSRSRSTPSCSGHWWWEGPIWLEQVLIELPAVGRPPDHAEPGTGRARGRRRGRSPPRPGERARIAAPGTRRRSPISPGRRADSSCGCCGRCRRGRLRGPALLSVPPGSCSRVQASDWAFLDYGRQTGDYPYPAPARPLAGAVRGHRMRRVGRTDDAQPRAGPLPGATARTLSLRNPFT